MITQRRVLVAIFLAMLIGLSIVWIDFLRTPLVTTPEGIRFKVPLGSSYKTVSTGLVQQHILQHPTLFNLLFIMRRDTHHLKAGEYFFAMGSTPGSMIDQMVTGTGLVFHAFTIVPGTNFRQLRAALDRSDQINHTTRNLSDEKLMTRLGHPELHPEGEFYPDTYYFVEGSSDLILLKRAFQAMQNKLNVEWSQRARDVPYKSPYEALIAASIIEKEAHVKEELPIIAGVLKNRLNRNILLQFDPTVIYGIGTRYNGTIYKRDLADNNPYNTYLHKGLPPTPISMPSLPAISAVLHPDHNDFLYFVARGDHATHQFSRTLPEHYAAVEAFRKYNMWFFNSTLVKKYLLKSLPQTVFTYDY